MTPLEASFEDVLKAYWNRMGGVQRVTINGTEYDAMISDASEDIIVVLGGNGDKGGFKASCRVRDFTSMPEKFTPISYDGVSLRILGPAETTNKAAYTFIAGDPVTNE